MDLFKEHGVTLAELIDRVARQDGDNLPETLELIETLAREAGYTK